MADIAGNDRSATAQRAAEFARPHVAATARPHPANSSQASTLLPLTAIEREKWQALSDNASEPNAYYTPGWERAVNAHVSSRGNVSALAATDRATQRLIGLLPAISAWRAYKIPLPVLVSADPYSTLQTPLLDRDHADFAASELLQQARDAGARALILRDIPIEGPTLAAFSRVLGAQNLRPDILNSHERASLDATRGADDVLRDALGPKKLKELRRQRNRLADEGDVIFTIAATPAEVAHDVETFLKLEASGWKGKRGTALIQDDGDAAFIREATAELAARGQCEIVTLHAGDTPIASGVIVKHLGRAFYFKLGVDERFAKLSPGVQLTLDVTRHLCDDPSITFADSTAIPGHPMIDPIWRGRLAIGDVLIPLYRRDPVTPALRAALYFRNTIREPARRAVHFIRHLREKKS